MNLLEVVRNEAKELVVEVFRQGVEVWEEKSKEYFDELSKGTLNEDLGIYFFQTKPNFDLDWLYYDNDDVDEYYFPYLEEYDDEDNVKYTVDNDSFYYCFDSSMKRDFYYILDNLFDEFESDVGISIEAVDRKAIEKEFLFYIWNCYYGGDIEEIRKYVEDEIVGKGYIAFTVEGKL